MQLDMCINLCMMELDIYVDMNLCMYMGMFESLYDESAIYVFESVFESQAVINSVSVYESGKYI